MAPIPGFPARHPFSQLVPLSENGLAENPALPPVVPFIRAAARALDRNEEDLELHLSDFSPRSRNLFLGPEDRSPSPLSVSSDSTGRDSDYDMSDGENNTLPIIGEDGDEPDEPYVVGASAVLPPPDTITGPVEVEAIVPALPRNPVDPSPYAVQIDLPRNFLEAGIDIRTRVRVHVSSSRHSFTADH